MTLFVTSITHLLMFYQYIPTNEQNSGFTHDILLNSDTSIIILNIVEYWTMLRFLTFQNHEK